MFYPVSHLRGTLPTITMALLLASAAVWAQDPRDREILQVRPNFYVLAGPTGNTSIQTGEDGSVVIDGGPAADAERTLAQIKKLTSAPIRFIVNTSADRDYIGANDALAKAGVPIIPVGGSAFELGVDGRATILAELHVLSRLSSPGQDGGKAFPQALWPTDTYSAEIQERRKDLYVNGEGIQLFYEPAAHSDGDSIVLFRRSDVIVAGSIVDAERFPVIDVDKGGSIQGEIEALNTLIDLAIVPTPFVWQSGGTIIVPGHGGMYDRADLVEYRDMITIIRDRVADMIRRGMNLEQIQKADPTLGYRRQYGSDTGSWTTGMFVSAIYKSLVDSK